MVVEEHFLPSMAAVSRDGPRDVEGVGCVRVGPVEDTPAGVVRGGFDQSGDVPGRARVVDAAATAGQEKDLAPVQYAVDEHPFTGLGRPLSMDFGWSQNGDRVSAVEQDTFRGDLVGAVAVASAVVEILAWGHGRLRLADRAVELRCGGGVHVVAHRIDVHGLAGDHHRGPHVVQQKQQITGVRGGEAQTVDHQIRPRTERHPESAGFAAVRGDEPATRDRDILGHARGVSADNDHLPPGVRWRDRSTLSRRERLRATSINDNAVPPSSPGSRAVTNFRASRSW
ncbi:hypothetical protein [Amycolatopsis sp. WAC 01375]|uniref:hypothetical protein n=1 Tax=Amycolatopsis sp. WAC 01375 TaxID=2203194 RepID=UPI001315848F|nr:hypothetical protein [Amycolatopsis sp. WAC 01375]